MLFLGFIVASTAWVKNEGIVFFLAFSILFMFKRKKIDAYYLLGISFPLAVLLFFKLKFASANYLIADQDHDILDKILDFDRYTTIFGFALKSVVNMHLPITLLIFGLIILNIRTLKGLGYKVLSVMVIVYFMVYIVTPRDLDWHLATSFGRLAHHIGPALFYLLILSTIQNKTLTHYIDRFVNFFKLDRIF